MSQQSSSESAQELSGNASKKNGGSEAVDQGFAALKEGLVKDSSQLTGGLRDLATGVAGDAKNAVEGQLDSQKGRVVEGLGGIAEALRRVSTRGDGDESAIAPALVPYIEEAADRVERASAYFDQKSLGEVARDVEDFARREPAFFLGGAFALGLLGGRFLKASQPANASYGSYGQQRERSRSRQSTSQRNDRLMASQRQSRQHEGGNGHSEHLNGASQRQDHQADGNGKNMNGDRKPVGA